MAPIHMFLAQASGRQEMVKLDMIRSSSNAPSASHHHDDYLASKDSNRSKKQELAIEVEGTRRLTVVTVHVFGRLVVD